MKAPLSEEEAAARRERLREYHRAFDASRLANGVCLRCGEGIRTPSPWRGYCLDCRNRKMAARRERRRERSAAERERRESALRAELEARGTPVCPRCGGSHIERLRKPLAGRTFRCRDCKEARRQTAAAARFGSAFPCPYCRSRCRKRGYDRRGQQNFHCTACGRCNTLLRANAQVLGTAPALRHRFKLVVGVATQRALTRYCAVCGLKIAPAVREIFRRYARPVTGCVRIRQHTDAWGEEASVVTRRPPPAATPPLRFAEAPLPAITAASLRARRREQTQQGLLHLPRPVGVVRSVTVLLDDEAWEGLHRMTGVLKRNHQEAARWMIEQQARP